MPTIARTDPGTTIVAGHDTFKFGDDGTRRVTAAEREFLENLYEGPASITFEDAPTSGKSKAQDDDTDAASGADNATTGADTADGTDAAPVPPPPDTADGNTIHTDDGGGA